MIVIPTLPPRHARRKPTPPTPPTLVYATYEDGAWVTLAFDRPVALADVRPADVLVADAAINGSNYQGAGVNQLDATTVRFTLGYRPGDPPPGIHLDVTADVGIVDATTGAPWAGVTGLALPFPPG